MYFFLKNFESPKILNHDGCIFKKQMFRFNNNNGIFVLQKNHVNQPCWLFEFLSQKLRPTFTKVCYNWKNNGFFKIYAVVQPGSYQVLPVLHGNTTILTYYWCLLPGNTTNFQLFNMKLIFSPMYALNTKLKKNFFSKIRNSVKIENNLVIKMQ